MLATRILIAVLLPWLGLLAGCGRPGGGAIPIVGGHKNAMVERSLTEPHVPGAGIDVRTDAGSLEIVADPELKEVKVTAKVTAFGDTDEEARARLADIKVKIGRRDDRVLEITAEYPKERPTIRGTCSFVVRIPEVNGSQVRTGNGTVTLKGLGGAAEVDAGVGSITVANQGGNLTAKTGNGSVQVTKTAGDVHLTASVGSVTVRETGGWVKAKTGNGTMEVTKTAGAVEAHAAVGSIAIRETIGNAMAKTGNGTLEVTKASGAVEANATVGSVTIRDVGGAVAAGTGNGTMTIAQVQGAAKVKATVGSVILDGVSGEVEAATGNGTITHAPASDSNSSFNLKASVGSITVRLPASAGGTIHADASVGSVTVGGSRQPLSVTGGRASKQIVMTEKGPASKCYTGNGTITITPE